MNSNDKKPDPWSSNVNDGTNSTTIAIIVAALVLAVGAFIFFGSSTTPTRQQLTENQVTPAPVTEPAAPLPVTPAANEPATPPVTPPADAPAANP
jgi:hypothetical protein